MTVCVVGLGKIGLPLAVQVASRGHDVVGADIAHSVVEDVNAGRPPFPNEAGLDELLADVVSGGRFRATVDVAKAVSLSDVVLVVVPLLVDDSAQPDFRAMDEATSVIGGSVKPGTLVSYETTLPVGTTRRRFTPELARLSRLTIGTELFVCHSPERVFSGRVFQDLARYPKLVGGVDDASEARAVAFYETALAFDERPDLPRANGVWRMGGSEAAEFAKLAETTYRDVNIALANEFAAYAEQIGVDFDRIADASNSQPFSHIHRPGIAVGGHCIPVYPRFYLAGDEAALLPAVARTVNEAGPARAIARLESAVEDLNGKRVAVLGAAYRGGVKETAFSGVFAVVAQLEARGARAAVHDPLYDDEELRSLGFEPYHFGDPADAAVVQTDHAVYATLTAADLPGVAVIYDGRGVLGSDWPGVILLRLGAPTAQETQAAELP